jgi:hypothetical protein
MSVNMDKPVSHYLAELENAGITENLAAEWAKPEASLEEQSAYLVFAMGAIHSRMILNKDGRFDVGLGLLLSGGGQQMSTLQAAGDGGTGKTTWGNLVMGESRRIDIESSFTAADIFGYPSLMTPDEYVKGKLSKGYNGDPAYFFNEMGHMRNTGNLHRLWDGRELEVEGRAIEIAGAAIYMATNFPDGNRVHKQDEQWRSRITAEVVSGDHDRATAVELNKEQEHDRASGDASLSLAPLLPDRSRRAAINELLVDRYSAGQQDGEQIAEYIVKVLEQLNGTGLIAPLSVTDSRVRQSLYAAARARKWVDAAMNAAKNGGFIERAAITPADIAKVAAFTLPIKSAGLTRVAKDAFLEATEDLPRPLERAIAVRRYIAATAFRVLHAPENEDAAAPIIPKTEREARVNKALADYAYVNPRAVNVRTEALDKAMGITPAEANATEEKADGKRKFSIRRSKTQ